MQQQPGSKPSSTSAVAIATYSHPVRVARRLCRSAFAPDLHHRDRRAWGSYPDATAVVRRRLVGLVTSSNNLNRGLDMAATPSARNRPGDRSRGKPGRTEHGRGDQAASSGRSGGRVVVTQRSRLESVERFLKRIEHTRIPVIAGSGRSPACATAEFMVNELRVRCPNISWTDAACGKRR